MSARILLIGPGDLGQRLAIGLVMYPEVGELLLAGRERGWGISLANLLETCGTSRVRFCRLDAHRRGDVEQLLRRERPDLVIQCAADLSPWWIFNDSKPISAALIHAGFSLQLPVQLSIVLNIMQAVRTVNSSAFVVNAAYPDVTHPILATLGLAPTVGIGNSGMIEAIVRASIRRQPNIEQAEPIRVIAHHAHVTSAMRACPSASTPTRPRIYLGEDGRRADELAYSGSALPSDRSLNALSSAVGLPLLRALLGGPAIRTSAPGPEGMPGGWPLRVGFKHIEFDLPPGTTQEEVTSFQWKSARQDGIDRISPNGTVFFTEEAQAALKHTAEDLSEPLCLEDIEKRRELLFHRLGIERG